MKAIWAVSSVASQLKMTAMAMARSCRAAAIVLSGEASAASACNGYQHPLSRVRERNLIKYGVCRQCNRRREDHTAAGWRLYPENINVAARGPINVNGVTGRLSVMNVGLWPLFSMQSPRDIIRH